LAGFQLGDGERMARSPPHCKYSPIQY
jgi:hypothetical protein